MDLLLFKPIALQSLYNVMFGVKRNEVNHLLVNSVVKGQFYKRLSENDHLIVLFL